MELYYPAQSSWSFLFPPFLLSPFSTPHNHVHWTETPDSHLYTADLPGVSKEEIRVELEDSRYLVIRIEWGDDDGGDSAERERRSFMRKFRLPQMIDRDAITAAYVSGVLTVTVPRLSGRRRLVLSPEDLQEAQNSAAAGAA